MANSPFDLKNRINSTTVRNATPTLPPQSRRIARSQQRHNAEGTSLSIRKVIGTTTVSAGGLASHSDSSRFAYCAGSAAVLVRVDDRGELLFRYFRAHPTVSPIHPPTSFYNPATTPTGTPESSRRVKFPARKAVDEKITSKSPHRSWAEEGSSRPWNARERVKAVSCVHLSNNGRFLAVGESGRNPRVMIFPVVDGKSEDIPLTILSEHTFGVRSVSFSNDSRWLATLGDVSDGFLLIWSINAKTGAAKLRYTNKCTVSVLDMEWCGNNLITVGVRHVKIWRVEDTPGSHQGKQGRLFLEDGSASAAPKTLPGRNCRLGNLMDSTFTCVKSFSDYEAVLCTTDGAICLLDDHAGNQRLKHVKQMNSTTQAAAVDLKSHRIWLATSADQVESESFESLRNLPEHCSSNGPDKGGGHSAKLSCSSSSTACGSREEASSSSGSWAPEFAIRGSLVTASTCLPGWVVTVDQERTIRIQSSNLEKEAENLEPIAPIILPSHNDPVQGVISLAEKAALGNYATWSLKGAVKFWSLDGSLRRQENVGLDQPDQADPDERVNELRVVRICRDGQWIVAGDRLGVLQLIEQGTWSVSKTRAHGAEVTDVALKFTKDSLLVASGSRDRTVQLLEQRGAQLEVVQTFDDHTAAVNVVAFAAEYLISASSDRTVVVRQQFSKAYEDGRISVIYISKKVITLKASPMSLAFPRPDEVVVSSMDKQILTFSLPTGVLLDVFKTSDVESEDAVVLTALKVDDMRNDSGLRKILTAFSTIDKSIRVYDFDRSILLAKEMGHAEGISAMVTLETSSDIVEQGSRTLVSTGLDGLVIAWEVSATQPCIPSAPQQGSPQGQVNAVHNAVNTPTKDSILRQSPQRKVISKPDFDVMFGPESPAPFGHELSSPRLKQKPSRHSPAPRRLHNSPTFSTTLSTAEGCLDRADVVVQSSRQRLSCLSPTAVNSQIRSSRHSPSISCLAAWTSPAIDSSRCRRPHETKLSPYPPPAWLSLSTTAKPLHQANRGQLRKVSSIPTGLGKTMMKTPRRWSSGLIDRPTRLGMVGDQICGSLQAFRKEIQSTTIEERGQLSQVEIELIATLRLVEKRHNLGESRTSAATKGGLEKVATLKDVIEPTS